MNEIKGYKKKNLNAQVLGFENNQPIYCTEHLTVQNAKILRKAKILKREGVLALVWSKDDNIFIKENIVDQYSIKIKSIEQLYWQSITGEYEVIEIPEQKTQTQILNTPINQAYGNNSTKRKERSPEESNQQKPYTKKLQLHGKKSFPGTKPPAQPTLPTLDKYKLGAGQDENNFVNKKKIHAGKIEM